ncbi:MAG TPA: transcription-repair coupling factor [Candidatus Wirthbacteria bacterium]|nr:transcription-repair coupling factor [Candidatus Wirthbacteria bacterium]
MNLQRVWPQANLELAEKYLGSLAESTSLHTNLYLIQEAREFVWACLLYLQVKQQIKTQKYLLVADSANQARQMHGRLCTWSQHLDLGQTRHHIHLATQDNYQDLLSFSKQDVSLLVVDQQLFCQPVPSQNELKKAGLDIALDSRLSLNQLVSEVVDLGYEQVDMVENINQIAKRGGIVDIYPAAYDCPLRIELWGDEVASIRFFSTADQRSLQSSHNTIKHAFIAGLENRLFTGKLTDYLGATLLILSEDLQLGFDLSNHRVWNLVAAPDRADLSFDFEPQNQANGTLSVFYRHLAADIANSYETSIISNQAKRLKNSLDETKERIYANLFYDHLSKLEKVNFIQSEAQAYAVNGFCSKQLNLSLYTDFEIFGLVTARSQSIGHVKQQFKNFMSNIELGDLVVHQDHGLAILSEILKTNVSGVEREYFLLQFAEEDKLYLPTSQVHKLTKYLGKDKDQITLNKLGGSKWTKSKRKAEVDTAAMAKELLDLYTKREMSQAHVYLQDDYLQKELEASFPFLETPDQLRALHEVKQDMESSRIMDRLICGDVGFGKTEVALRAAFKAVLSNKQVAFLCPTTILANQHYALFNKRLSAFGTSVELVNRFRKPSQIKSSLEKLSLGEADVIIGTHRLLSADVQFANLGLLIIDEEQRFGVKQKEAFKALRANVDVLSLSATPIPRTLNLSLSGIRDISLINTPPKGRLPIITKITNYSDELIKQAIQAELERQGQVIMVYNKVNSIDQFAETIAALVPEARIVVGHGQLSGKELEEKMYSFINGKIDVLLCSTIIENGVDIPTANTMIVVGAEDFGLASLYQLRGRVGRSEIQAFAYFLKVNEIITPEARKRLDAILEATELGSGLSLAMRDLEIRGAGNILGVSQSGHIEGVGFELYANLLKKAVREQKALIDKQILQVDAPKKQPGLSILDVSVDLPLSAYLPDDYINDPKEKMTIYQRLSELSSIDELQEISLECLDRFGPLPNSLMNLLTLLKFRILASAQNISKIWIKSGILYYDFVSPAPFGYLTKLVKIHRDWQLSDKTAKILFAKLGENWLDLVEASLSI